MSHLLIQDHGSTWAATCKCQKTDVEFKLTLCRDSVGERTLQSATFNGDDVTDDNCIIFCDSQGYSYAGTEVSCFQWSPILSYLT
jgi:hypothetical protein